MHTGLFGTNETFIPMQGAEIAGDRVTVAYDKATIKDAPNIGEDGHLSPQDEQRLYRHYGVDYGSGGTGTGRHRDRHRAASWAPRRRHARPAGTSRRETTRARRTAATVTATATATTSRAARSGATPPGRPPTGR